MEVEVKRLFFFVFLFLILVSFNTYAITKTECLGCHEYMEPKVNSKILNDSVHKDLECTYCHSDVTNIPHNNNLMEVKCVNCHGEEGKLVSQSVHSEAEKDISKMCKNCHGTHNVLPKDNENSMVNPMNLPATCSNCHQNEQFVANHKLPQASFIKDYTQSVHGSALTKSGLVISATCVSCHGDHLILPPDNEKSTIYKKNVPETCGTCHLGILNRYNNSIHKIALDKGNEKAPVCTTCHTTHTIKRIDRLSLYTMEDKECGGCHTDKAPSYRDTFHGKATSLGFIRGALCSDCHRAHNILPKDHPESSVNKANLDKTCGNCHGKVTKSFTSFIAHPDLHDKTSNPILYYVYLFMTLLLISVFGFFGLHDILWLQRSIVAYFKGEFKHFDRKDKWVKRFSKTTIITHIVIIISFLGLAATGIPLRFHYTGWAQVFANFLGGVEVARYIHRVCAVLTFGYAITHLVFLLYQIIVKRKYNYLYGHDSLVPRFKDFTDLYDNIKWFFYAGERPKIGHWTYWEKFDYFAVFWGIPVIGFSGLILWFPEFFSNFLPGFLLNIAALVHAEEALLAVGFIFLFHFFHTHLRPESFPLDTVVFLGKQPLERLKEERPEEYERLVQSGDLEKLIVEPPSEDIIKISKIFGFIFLTIGLIIIVAILITFFASLI